MAVQVDRETERRQQFEALALPLLNHLYAMALHLVREPARADDIVQETYLRAWQNFDRFTAGTHFKAWIFQILIYYFLNEQRNARRREKPVDFTEDKPVVAPPAPDAAQLKPPASNWEEVYPTVVDDVVRHALDRLPAEQREVFLLVTLGDLSYKECADALRIPIGTVMSRLFRARKQLQDELKDYAREKGFVGAGGRDGKNRN